MNPIVVTRIADMRYYRGITQRDTPANGGKFVNETGLAHECFNFLPIIENGEDYEKCIGYFQMNNYGETLHIENIVGCSSLKHEEYVDGVTVVFASKAPGTTNMRVCGFYKNARVYKNLREMIFAEDDVQHYWFEAKRQDCVLLPYQERHSNNKWFIPSSTSKYHDYGMGRSNIWYPAKKGASKEEIMFTERLINSAAYYDGENWMDKEV